MGIKFIDNLIDKIAEYLPDDEPATEEERIYEEGKKRVYEMHQREDHLFYVEEAWIEKGQGNLYGEVVKGKFASGDLVTLLDVHGNVLKEMELVAFKENPEEEKEAYQESKKGFLLFEIEKVSEIEDFFVRSYYVTKKH